MTEFHSVAKASEIAEGTMKTVALAGERIVIANLGGEFRAFSDRCTHYGGPLGDGQLDGESVRCPRHGGVFNIVTGAHESGLGNGPVPVYEVRLDGDEIQIGMD